MGRSPERDRDRSDHSDHRRERSRSRERERERDPRDTRDSYRRDPRDTYRSADSRPPPPPSNNYHRGGGGGGGNYSSRPSYPSSSSSAAAPSSSSSQSQSQSASNYYANPSAQSVASADPSTSAASSSADSFRRFQEALALHNAARNVPALEPISTSGTAAAPPSAKKVTPVLLEELVSHRTQAEHAPISVETLEKPVYLTKAQRAEIALAKLNEKRAQAESMAASQQASMQSFLSAAKQAEEAERQSRLAAERRVREERERKREEEMKQREKGGRDKSSGRGAAGPLANALQTEQDLVRARERELQLIRLQYLGEKDPLTKKKATPANQRFKFHFDWDAKEDTSIDTNVLYKHRHEAAALFGRGFVGGVDRKEQRKKHAFYEDLVQHRLAQKEEEAKNAATQSGVKDEPMPQLETAHGDLASQRNLEKVHAREQREALKRAEDELKNRHWSEKKLEEMVERDWRIFKEDFEIATKGTNIPHSLRYWSEANLPESLMRALDQAGYTNPTPIQRVAIPIGMQFRDVIGIAETGSGKTCAFLVPMLVYISKKPAITPDTSGEGPYAMVMAPTRELAQQISEECDKFSTFMNIRNCCVVGGLSIEEQAFKLREGVEVLIGTPGRIYDLVRSRFLALNQCNYVVLDEADRMIDYGFEAQITQIMDKMPSSNEKPDNYNQEGFDESKHVYRQTVLFSATMVPRVEALAKTYLRDPVFISVGDRTRAATRVEQRIEWLTSEGQKKPRLLELMRGNEGPTIIFSNLKANIDKICKWLSEIGVRSVALHADRSQVQRGSALASFKAGEVPVLVATDVAGRGLDVKGVKLVVNFDLPHTIDAYKHRIGRTGRAGQTGLAISFLLESDSEIMFDLVLVLKASNQEIPPQLANHEAAKFPPGSIREGGGAPKKHAKN